MWQKIKSILSFCLSLAVIIFIFLIRSNTSKNYFNEQLTQEEKNKFFYNTETNPLIKQSEIGIKCQMYQNIIMDEKITKLGDVFNLNIEIIHGKTTSFIIIWIVLFLFSAFNSCCFVFALSIQNKTILYICLTSILISYFTSYIVIFILLYKLIFAFYYSDMNQFVQFLKCRNVVKEGFIKYLYMENLQYYLVLFIICAIIDTGFNFSNYVNNITEKRSERNNNEIELENIEN